MRICPCGRTTYGMHSKCGHCRTPKPRKQRTPLKSDLSAAEIERIYQQELARIRWRRQVGTP